MSISRVPDPAGWNRSRELQARIIELEDDLRRIQGQAGERIAELQAEVNVLLERNNVLQYEVTRLERHNGILEQRLRRIGDAVVEGRVELEKATREMKRSDGYMDVLERQVATQAEMIRRQREEIRNLREELRSETAEA